MSRHLMIAAVAASCLVTSAQAGTCQHAVAVRHADLNLRTPKGVARLDRRIWRAADEACGAVSTTDLVGMNRRSRCVVAAVAAAGPQRDAVLALSPAPQLGAR